MTDVALSVSDALGALNGVLGETFPFIVVEGEVASFKVNQGKFAFFDIKDDESTLGCFMMAFKLKFPLEDGMTVRVVAQPKITQWGKFSLTVEQVTPVGEGSLKKSFELLKAKLSKEGLFDAERKRLLPQYPVRIGVVSSSQAAGYRDFIKIVENRWAGLSITLVDVTVQGADAPAQLVGAIGALNELPEPLDVIAVIRGGGSADDLAAFNHEDVVRAVAASRTPTIVGVGHEVDVTLADLVADVRAATPSNAAELLVPDKRVVSSNVETSLERIHAATERIIDATRDRVDQSVEAIGTSILGVIDDVDTRLHGIERALVQLNPEVVLNRGYAIIRSGTQAIRSVQDVTIASEIDVELTDGSLKAEVTDVREK